MKTRTHLRVIALYLLLILCISLPQSAWGQDSQMNIYATKLATVTDVTCDGRVATLRFGLNSDASSVTIYVDANDNEIFEANEAIPTPYTMVSGNYKRDVETTVKCTIPANFKGGKHNWAVQVSATSYNNTAAPQLARAANNHDNRYIFHLPKALAISANPDNPYCGFAFVGEAGSRTGLTKPDDKDTYRTGSNQGIYVFGPSLGAKYSNGEKVTASPFGAFKGNVDWWTNDPTTYNYGPSHLAVDRDGYVYVCQIHRTYKTNGEPSTEIHNRVWRVHADQLQTGQPYPAFESVLTTDTLYANGLSKRTLAIAVGENSNGSKVLYVISGTLHSTESTLDGSQKLSCWTIQENGDGTCNLVFVKKMDLETIAYKTKAGATKNQSLVSPLCSLAPDKEGGLWIFQKASSSADDEKFAALHLNSNWQADYRIPSKDYHNISGGGAVSTHYAKDHTSDYYLAMPSEDNGISVIQVFRIYKSDGTITRSKTYTIARKTDNFGTLNAVAFDAANNLYFTNSYDGKDANTGRLYVYALPKENSHQTSAPTREILYVPYKVTSWESSVTEYKIEHEKKTYMYDTDPMPVLSKEGYIFHGWYDKADFTGEPITSVQRDYITLYAEWTEVKINEGTEVDNTPIIDLVNAQDVSIKVNRKLQGGMFSTLCLPFSVTDSIMDQATTSSGTPLADATLWVFDNVSTDEEGTKTLHFTQTSTVDANTPFLILPTQDIAEDIFFHNVTISKPEDLSAAGEASQGDITFHGVINPIEIKAGTNTFFLVADNRLAAPNNDSILPGLRGYFTAPEGAKLQIRTQQDTPTLLENVTSNSKNAYKILQDGRIYIIRDQIIYDLQGNRVGADF